MDDFNFFEDFSNFKENSPFTKKLIDMLGKDKDIYNEAIGNLEANEEEKASDNVNFLLFRLLVVGTLLKLPEEQKADLTADDIEALTQTIEEQSKFILKMLEGANAQQSLNALTDESDGRSLEEMMNDLDPSSMPSFPDMSGMMPPMGEFPGPPDMSAMGGIPGLMPISIGDEKDMEQVLHFIALQAKAKVDPNVKSEIDNLFANHDIKSISDICTFGNDDEEELNNNSEDENIVDHSNKLDDEDDDFDF